VGRGGDLLDARSNITMQRSAKRSRLMTALRRSRPLMVALDICVCDPGKVRRRRAGCAVSTSQSVAALQSNAYDLTRSKKARLVGRGWRAKGRDV
jgi:hypothetical protein